MTDNDPWADFSFPEKIQVTSSRYNHYSSRRKGLPPLEQLAWAEMEEAEFVERAANEVWRRPCGRNWRGEEDFGRVGVSRSKATNLVRLVGKHLPPREKKRIVERVLKRADELFERACKAWAIQALEIAQEGSGEEITLAQIRNTVSAIVPKGGVEATMQAIRKKLKEQNEVS
jgi:hypothetical protein